MTVQDPQEVWRAYYKEKKAQRITEASQLWAQMQGAGVGAEADLALDFVHFGTVESDVEALAEQLSENYKMEVVRAAAGDAWLAKGTTRPYCVNLSEAQHIGWAEFMADVSQSYGCVFSTWLLEAPSLGARFESEHLNGGA